ncbi:unnamed protein product [Caretta caretta]
MEPAGNLAEFSIRNVSRRDAGSYSCYYQHKGYPFMWSQPSDPVELVVAEPSYPKPNISLHPSEGVTLGGAVTVRCECRCRGARVFLNKSGDPDARHATDSAGDLVEFPIHNVSRRDAGSYSCQYSTKWGPPVWSEPSDPVELVVAGSPKLQPQSPQEPDPEAEGLTYAELDHQGLQAKRGGPAPAPEPVLYAAVNPQEPDPSAEGFTYAQLDRQALQAKRRDPDPAPEPLLYVTINISRGPDGQNPQGG